MGVLELLDDGDVVELDVEILVDALQRASELDVVFELDRDLVVDEGFEEAGKRPLSVCIMSTNGEAWNDGVCPPCMQIWEAFGPLACVEARSASALPEEEHGSRGRRRAGEQGEREVRKRAPPPDAVFRAVDLVQSARFSSFFPRGVLQSIVAGVDNGCVDGVGLRPTRYKHFARHIRCHVTLPSSPFIERRINRFCVGSINRVMLRVQTLSSWRSSRRSPPPTPRPRTP